MKTLLFTLSFLFSIVVKAQWNYISIPDYIEGAWAVSSDSNLFFSNNAGKMYYSHNGGVNWNYFTTEYDSEFFQDFDFVNDSVGFVCGGGWFSPHRNIVMKTSNAGQTWETITRDSLGLYQFLFDKIDFVNEDSGMVASTYGLEVFRTLDGGANWQQVFIDTQNENKIADLQFINGGIGLLTTAGGNFPHSTAKIFKTSDFGATWQLVKEWDYNNAFLKIHFVNDQIVYIGGTSGKLFKSTDAGNSWTAHFVSPGNDISALYFTQENVGYCNALGPVSKTTNGGADWFTQLMFPINIVDDIQFAPSGHIGFLKANKLLYKTTNGGSTGIDQNLVLKNKIKIYPNPASQFINISYPKMLVVQAIQLVDAVGNYSKTFDKNASQLNVNGLPSGAYYLIISTTEGQLVEQIIVE